MKKMMVMLIFVLSCIIFLGCEDDSEPPPEFTNGLTAEITDKTFSASRDVECVVTQRYGYKSIEFRASKDEGEHWLVKFRLDDETEKNDILISDDVTNEITLDSEDVDVGKYSITGSDPLANETSIRILKFEPDEIIEGVFSGFIYKTGESGAADSLKSGYFITKTFTSTE
ncbi:MAG: hypothetical protein R6V47_00075 [Candidatus Delongbacteria bacterium]